jgi:hypothetical protein
LGRLSHNILKPFALDKMLLHMFRDTIHCFSRAHRLHPSPNFAPAPPTCNNTIAWERTARNERGIPTQKADDKNVLSKAPGTTRVNSEFVSSEINENEVKSVTNKEFEHDEES